MATREALILGLALSIVPLAGCETGGGSIPDVREVRIPEPSNPDLGMDPGDDVTWDRDLASESWSDDHGDEGADQFPDGDHGTADLDGHQYDDSGDPGAGDSGDPGEDPDTGVTDAGDHGSDDPGADTGPDWIGLFDMVRIGDASTADCLFENRRTVTKNLVLLDVWEISYLSFESVNGSLRPIRIRGYASRPQAAGTLPGIVQAHGLGGMSEESHATGTASLLGMFVLAYTGPGGGDKPANTSEGLPAGHDDGYRMFDTVTDPRGSWFWAHAVAGMRGLTCLQTRSDVDDDRLGMTGYSAGGVVTLISSAVDNRIKAAVPLGSSGGWDEAVKSPNAWQHALLTEAGLTTSSPEWTTLIANLDSRYLLPGTSAKIMMINGTSDEFFPLTAHMATFNAIPGNDKRNSFSGNYDHGCYQFTGGEDKETIEARAALRAAGGQRMWFRHWLGTDADYAYVPQAPQVTLTPNGGLLGVAAAVDGGGSKLEVEEVRVWGSNDDAFLFISEKLDAQGGNLYGKIVPFQMQGNSVVFVDVQYKTKALISPGRFAISSPPTLPAGFVPRIRSVTTCM